MPPPDLEEGWCETGDPLLGLAVPGLGSKCGIIPGLRSGLAKVGLRTALAAPEPPNDTPPKLDLEAMDVCQNNYINGYVTCAGFFCAESIQFLAKKMRDKAVLAF